MEKRKSKYQVKIRHKAKNDFYKVPLPWRNRIEKTGDALEEEPFYVENMRG